MREEADTKAAVSVSDMARMVGLSRARFYQLVKAGTFPAPDTDPTTGRPCYREEKQQVCLEVRRRNCGIDGKPVLFYARRLGTGPVKAKPKKPKAVVQGEGVAGLLDGLNALGLTTATGAQLERLVQELYPKGIAGQDQSAVLRAVFLHLRHQNTAGNVEK